MSRGCPYDYKYRVVDVLLHYLRYRNGGADGLSTTPRSSQGAHL